jgi:hypothetical protein
MTVTDLLQKIKANLKQRKTEIGMSMVEGRMADLQSYHKHVGVAEGLQQSIEIIDETLKKLNEEDD